MTDTAGDPLPTLARSCWQSLELVHVLAYFAPEPRAAYKALGLGGTQGYFASRSAAMGPVPGQLTTATFYVFSPALVASVIPAAWDIASPAQVLQARHEGMTAVLERVLPGLPDDNLAEALELARRATDGLSAPARPLYAAHAALPWPEHPLLALWHAGTLLREHRGDGHLAALLVYDLDPVEALISYGLLAGTTPFLKASRGWSEAEWSAGEQRLRERGLLDDAGALTDAGRALRAEIEAATERSAEAGWRHLGESGCERLRELLKPVRTTLLDSGILPAALAASRR